jgi:hypothetical protein
MSDRALMMATFNAICGLAKRLTGEELTVEFTEDGRTIRLRGDDVSWSASPSEAGENQRDPRFPLHPKPSAPVTLSS